MYVLSKLKWIYTIHWRAPKIGLISNVSICCETAGGSVFLIELELLLNSSCLIHFPSWQIAAKIGGDVPTPMSNNGGAENYAFPAQKRSLEDAGQRLKGHLNGALLRVRVNLSKTCLLKTFCFVSSDQPDAKKMASQGDRDSALCRLNTENHCWFHHILPLS